MTYPFSFFTRFLTSGPRGERSGWTTAGMQRHGSSSTSTVSPASMIRLSSYGLADQVSPAGLIQAGLHAGDPISHQAFASHQLDVLTQLQTRGLRRRRLIIFGTEHEPTSPAKHRRAASTWTTRSHLQVGAAPMLTRAPTASISGGCRLADWAGRRRPEPDRAGRGRIDHMCSLSQCPGHDPESGGREPDNRLPQVRNSIRAGTTDRPPQSAFVVARPSGIAEGRRQGRGRTRRPQIRPDATSPRRGAASGRGRKRAGSPRRGGRRAR